MRYILGGGLLCLVAGCVGSPPAAPTAVGDYRPVNRPGSMPAPVVAPPVIPWVFEFKFDGDLADALKALAKIQPQLIVLPPVGNVVPVPVHVHLRAATLESALSAIVEQGGGAAEVVLNRSHYQGGNQVVVVYHDPEPAAPANKKGTQ